MDWVGKLAYVPSWDSINGYYESTSKSVGSWLSTSSSEVVVPHRGDGAQAEGPSSKHKQRRSNPSRQRRESERRGSDCDTFLMDEEEETSFVRPSSLLDGEERILGCFESNCHVQFGWMQGYRVCARCAHKSHPPSPSLHLSLLTTSLVPDAVLSMQMQASLLLPALPLQATAPTAAHDAVVGPQGHSSSATAPRRRRRGPPVPAVRAAGAADPRCVPSLPIMPPGLVG
jgi:hypothetical protein